MKKFTFCSLLSLALIAYLTSCENSLPYIPNEDTIFKDSRPELIREIDSIIKTNIATLKNFEFKNRRIKEIIPARNNNGRSTENDSSILIVNMNPDGFAIISQQRVDDKLIALAPQGNFPNNNPGLEIYLDIIHNDDNIDYSRILSKSGPNNGGVPFEKDTLSQYPIVEFDGKAAYYISHLIRTQTYGPFLKTTWAQWEPYNPFCPVVGDNGERGLVGCVGVAIGQN